MRLYIVYLFLFIFSSSGISAQVDSIEIKTDSVFNHYANNISKQERNFFSKPVVKSLIAPTILISYGLAALKIDALKQVNYNTKEILQKNYPHFSTHVDDYLQYAPAMAVYGLNAVGIDGKNNFRDRTIIYGLSVALFGATDFGLKEITHQQRPDGSSFNSFPSGHTVSAFAAAEFLHQEYKNISPWYGIAGYTVAIATGALRMYNNKHWLSDVIAGAGIGILTTKLSYWIYPFLKRKFSKHK